MGATSFPDAVARLDRAARTALLAVAHEAVSRCVRGDERWEPGEEEYAPSVREHRACFVTLQLRHRLRGCVGTLSAQHALVVEVAHAARSAALRDPRFPAVTASEEPLLHYHVSVLNEAEPLHAACERELVLQLRPGIDGVIVREGPHTGTFLPSVWKMIPSAADFLSQLRVKAGLARDHWSGTIGFSRFTTEAFGDPD